MLTQCLGRPGLSDSAECAAVLDTSCGRCVVTKESDATWGPVVRRAAGPVVLNRSGCILAVAAEQGGDARVAKVAACAAEVAQYDGCTVTCGYEACPVPECKGLAASDPEARACLPSTLNDGLRSVALRFCGP